MKWHAKDVCEIEKHPFKTFIPPYSHKLIVGTFPTYQNNIRFPFFYSGKENSFWNIIEQVFCHKFKYDSGEEAISERQAILTNNRIGITDMHQLCYRINRCSGDEYLYPIILKDVFSILNQHPTITRLVLTSRTGIYSALGLFKTYFLQQGRTLQEPIKRADKILEGRFTHNDREIEVLVPYSPSPRLKGKGVTTMEELIQMYSKCLNN